MQVFPIKFAQVKQKQAGFTTMEYKFQIHSIEQAGQTLFRFSEEVNEAPITGSPPQRSADESVSLRQTGPRYSPEDAPGVKSFVLYLSGIRKSSIKQQKTLKLQRKKIQKGSLMF